MSAVRAAGSALKARRSTRSKSEGSPSTAKPCSSEAIASTTAHVSVPRCGARPQKTSSAQSSAFGVAWYVSIMRSTSAIAAWPSEALPCSRYAIAGHASAPSALLTPWSLVFQLGTEPSGNLILPVRE
jgi:hypothetical protein